MVFVVSYILINLFEFILSAVDKKAAIHHGRRIPEKTLWLLAILGGAVGLFLSMRIFRHKTKHLAFVIGAPILATIQVALLIFLS